jgi:hypothetical protein
MLFFILVLFTFLGATLAVVAPAISPRVTTRSRRSLRGAQSPELRTPPGLLPWRGSPNLSFLPLR